MFVSKSWPRFGHIWFMINLSYQMLVLSFSFAAHATWGKPLRNCIKRFPSALPASGKLGLGALLNAEFSSIPWTSKTWAKFVECLNHVDSYSGLTAFLLLWPWFGRIGSRDRSMLLMKADWCLHHGCLATTWQIRVMADSTCVISCGSLSKT